MARTRIPKGNARGVRIGEKRQMLNALIGKRLDVVSVFGQTHFLRRAPKETLHCDEEERKREMVATQRWQAHGKLDPRYEWRVATRYVSVLGVRVPVRVLVAFAPEGEDG